MSVDNFDGEQMACRLAASDPIAFEQFDAHLRPLLTAFARQRGFRGEVVGDLVQDTLADACLKLRDGQFDGRSALTSWVHGIFVHKSLDLLRNRYRQKRLADSLRHPGATAQLSSGGSSTEQSAILEQALQLLPARERYVLIMNIRFGKPTRQIAIDLGLNKKTTEAILTSAKKNLRKVLTADKDNRPLKRLTDGGQS